MRNFWYGYFFFFEYSGYAESHLVDDSKRISETFRKIINNTNTTNRCLVQQ